MNRNIGYVGIFLCLISLLGCNVEEKTEEASAAPDQALPVDMIAVIDLNVVAHEIGAQEKIDRAMQTKKRDLENRLSTVKLAESDFQKREALQAQALQSQLLAHHAKLKQQFLSQVRPIALAVAQDQGMQIVMTTAQVYATGPGNDITQAVVKQILELNQFSPADVGVASESPAVKVVELPHGNGEFIPR